MPDNVAPRPISDAPRGGVPAAWRGAPLAISAFLATLYVPLWSHRELGAEAAFRYFAADAFYYLAIARNSLGLDMYTYDGVRPTNGFNPLWEYYLSAGFAQFAPDSERQILLAFLSSALLTATGVALFAAALSALVRRPWLVLLATVPGFYSLAFSMLDPHFGSTWSFVNGMESGLSILLFGLLCYLLLARELLSNPSALHVALASVIVTLITLSRLDDVFLFLPLLALVVLRSSPSRRRINTLIAASIPIAAISAYLLYNVQYAGIALPVSGVTKFYGLFNPTAWINTLVEAANAFAPPREGLSPWAWSGAAWRAWQLILPVAVTLWWSAGICRRAGGWRQCLTNVEPVRLAVLLIAALYVPAKAAYHLGYVHLWDQGHWYFPLSLMIVNMIAAVSLDELLHGRGRATSPATHHQPRVWVPLGLTGLYIVLSGNAFIQLKHTSTYGADFYNFWKDRDVISSRLNALAPAGGILEFDDGIVAFTLSRSTMSGMGLAVDAGMVRISEQGRLLDCAYQRGNRLISSVWYVQGWPADAFSNDQSLREAVRQLVGERIDGWTFTPLLYEQRPDYHYVILRFEPWPADSAAGVTPENRPGFAGC